MMARRLCFLVLLLLLLRPAPAGADKSPVPQGAAQSPAALHGPGAAELEEGLRLLDVSDYRGSLERLEKSLALASAGKDSTVQGWAHLCLARRALEMRAFDDAVRESLKAIEFFKSRSDGAGSFWAGVVRATALARSRRGRKAWAVMEELEKQPRAGLARECQVDFYLARGLMLLDREKNDSAQKNFEEAYRLALELRAPARTAEALRDLALCHSSEKRFEKAYEYCAAAIETALESRSPFLQGLVLETQGDIKREEARFAEARSQYLGALALYRQCGNRGRAGHMYVRITGAYIDESAWEKSFEYCRKAIEEYRASCDTWGRLAACELSFALMFNRQRKEDIVFLAGEYEELLRADLPREHRARALFLQGRTRRHFQMDYPGALESFEKAGELYGSIGEKHDALRCLMEEGALLVNRGRYSEALVLYDGALALRDTLGATVKEDDADFFNACSPGQIQRQKAQAYLLTARYAEALASYRDALGRDRGAERTRDRVMDRHGLVLVHLSLYDYSSASAEVRTAFDEIGTLKKPVDRAVLYNLVLMALMPTNRSEGLRIYESASYQGDSLDRMVLDSVYRDTDTVKKIREAYGDWIASAKERKDLTSLTLAYTFLGYFCASGGMDPEAADSFALALEAARKSGVAQWEGIVRIFMTVWHMERGRIAEAMGTQQEGLKVYERAGIRDGQLNALTILAALKRKAGAYGEALACYDKALAVSAEIAMPLQAARLSVNRATVLYLSKEYARSLQAFREALPSLEKLNDRSRIAISLAFTARCLKGLGRTGEALAQYRTAFAALKSLDSIFELRDTALEMGEILEKSGREKEALDCYLETLTRFTGFRESLPTARGLEGLSEQKATVELFERAVMLLLKAGRCDDALWYIELSRSQELLGAFDLDTIRTTDEKLLELLRKVKELRRRIAILRIDVEGTDDSRKRESLTGLLASTRQEFFAALNELRSRNPDFEQVLSVKGSDLAEIQKIIPADHLLLEYYPAKDALYIFVVTKGSFRIRTVAVGRERLYALVRELRSRIAEQAGEEELRSPQGLLYSFLVEPVAEELKTCRNVHVIPGGLLWYLPLEVLKRQGAPWLIEEKVISYVTSSDILRIVQRRAEPDRQAQRLVAFANPDAGLRETAGEVGVLGELFPTGKIFVGPDATRARFLAEAPKATLLHIATHSALDRENINRSFIQLSGADGKILLGDIYGLDLGGVRLVTLSSCESALGEEHPGREFASLASAFTAAGASSVVASLWRVEDAATAALFKAFYRHLRDGVPAGEALRRAKLELLRTPGQAHPFSWGGFVLFGAPR